MHSSSLIQVLTYVTCTSRGKALVEMGLEPGPGPGPFSRSYLLVEYKVSRASLATGWPPVCSFHLASGAVDASTVAEKMVVCLVSLVVCRLELSFDLATDSSWFSFCSRRTRRSGSRRSWRRRWGRTGRFLTGSAWGPITLSGSRHSVFFPYARLILCESSELFVAESRKLSTLRFHLWNVAVRPFRSKSGGGIVFWVNSMVTSLNVRIVMMIVLFEFSHLLCRFKIFCR